MHHVVHSQIERFPTTPLLFAFWRGRPWSASDAKAQWSGRGVLFGNPVGERIGKKSASPLGPKRSAGPGLALSGAPTTIGSPPGKQLGAGADAQVQPPSVELSRTERGRDGQHPPFGTELHNRTVLAYTAKMRSRDSELRRLGLRAA